MSGFWSTRSISLILAHSAVSGNTAPADTNENILATVSIPAGIIGANGLLLVTSLWALTNNANVKTVRTRLGGIGGTAFGAVAVTSLAFFRDHRIIENRGAQNSQITSPAASSVVYGGSTLGVTSGAIDTSAAQDLVITAQKATAGDTMTLESYLIAVLPRP